MKTDDVLKLERAAKSAKRKGEGGDLIAYWDSLRMMWRLCTPDVILEFIRVAKRASKP